MKLALLPATCKFAKEQQSKTSDVAVGKSQLMQSKWIVTSKQRRAPIFHGEFGWEVIPDRINMNDCEVNLKLEPTFSLRTTKCSLALVVLCPVAS
jgi:hypothetical protein